MRKQRVKSPAWLNNSAEEARAYAFLLLKFRLRSESELRTRLRQKNFAEALIQETLNFLREKEFINDQLFAKGWVASRIKRPVGLRRIKQELLYKGLSGEIIQQALSQVEGSYNESQIVNQLAKQRFSKIKGVQPLKAKARVYGFLLRRGFSSEAVTEAIRAL